MTAFIAFQKAKRGSRGGTALCAYTLSIGRNLGRGGGVPINGIVRMCGPNSLLFQLCQIYEGLDGEGGGLVFTNKNLAHYSSH